MKKFKYSFAVSCNKDQMDSIYNNMIELGYEYIGVDRSKLSEKFLADLCTNYAGGNDLFAFGSYREAYQSIKLDIFNKELILTLAAATQGDRFYKGEWVICTKIYDTDLIQFTKGKFYQIKKDSEKNQELVWIVSDDLGSNSNAHFTKYLRKPSAQEIIEHFSNVKYVVADGKNKPLEEYKSKQMEQIVGYRLKKDLPEVLSGTWSELNINLSCTFGGKTYWAEQLLNTEWFEPVYEEQSKTLILGSNNIIVEIRKNKIYTKDRIISISDLKDIMSHYKATGRIADWSILIDNNIRCIRIGCESENNRFSINEIQQVIDTYNQIK